MVRSLPLTSPTPIPINLLNIPRFLSGTLIGPALGMTLLSGYPKPD